MGRPELVGVLLCVSSALVAPGARAEKPAAATASPKLDLARLKKALESGDEAQKLGALGELAAAPPASAAAAAALVNELLTRGATSAVLEKALEVAKKLGQPSSSAAVIPYVRHRTPSLRRAAARALASTGGAEAVAALRAALRGSDAALRRDAASALAGMKAKDAVPDLFLVLGKDVPEAAGAIGELCGGADCQKLIELLGKLPFDLMQAGLEPILLRPESEIPESTKLDLIERLRKLQTQEASTFLKTVLARYPKSGNVRVRAGLEAAASGKPFVKPKP